MSNTSKVEEATIEDRYKKKEVKEHALMAPDTYIGSVEVHRENMWVMDEESGLMKEKLITYVPGLYKIYDEILVNAMDHWTRMEECIRKQKLMKSGKMQETPEVTLKMKFKPVRNIKVEINQEEGWISIYNDGNGIPVVIHKEEQVYVPELLFSQLLTSGNYQDDEKGLNQARTVGGKNGYGASLAALFSKRFDVETVDHDLSKKYTQSYLNNLSVIEKPNITVCRMLPYVKIKFWPDLAKFGLESLTDDMVSLLKKRVYDCAGWCTGVNVYFNDVKIAIKDFNQYTNLYLGDDRTACKRVYVKANERWEVCATLSPDNEFVQISMVNGILTSKGGRHVDHVANQICKKLAEQISTGKNKVDPRNVKANLWLFIRCIVESPGFDSQTKETMNTQVAKFGSKCELSLEDIKKMGKCGVTQRAKAFSQFKQTQMSGKNDGKKVNRVLMDKLDDARHAGKKESHKCTLIVTEGDSAKPFATEGLKAFSKKDREYWGVFPLKGKPLNVRTANAKQLDTNEELTALKKILGLQAGVKYEGLEGIKKLRYGRLMILTDQDNDGEHIKGLIMNMFHNFWPELLKSNRFLISMATPIVKVWKERKQGRKTVRVDVHKFYSENEYLNWKKDHMGETGWIKRYYKGLGTSKSDESQEVFGDKKIIQYIDPGENDENLPKKGKEKTKKISLKVDSDGVIAGNEEEQERQRNLAKLNQITLGMGQSSTDKAMTLAFHKDLADQRKQWLTEANLDLVNDYDITEETYCQFINGRLIQFSWADNRRSIPNVFDGLKTSQRKILYFMQKYRKNAKAIKVAQISSYASGRTAYKHGEKSMEDAIIGMAQNYVSSNNINLLVPEGNFGTRAMLGADTASSRYIYSKLENLANLIFRSEDMPLYNYLVDEEQQIEPDWFMPIIPMILVNGSNGIGTGYSTNLPQYNPLEIIELLEGRLKGKSGEAELHPWYRGFQGRMQKCEGGYLCFGKYEIIGDRIKVLEIPININFNKYKTDLEGYLLTPEADKKSTILHRLIKDVNADSGSCQVEIQFVLGGVRELLGLGMEKMEKLLQLRTKISTTNMTMFLDQVRIRKFDTVAEIIDNFYDLRMEFYERRKDLLIKELEFKWNKVTAKLRFVMEIMEDELVIYKKRRSEIEELLVEREYPKFTAKLDLRTLIGKSDTEDSADLLDDLNQDAEDNGDTEAKEKKKDEPSYQYLLSMKIDSFSEEILERLRKEQADHWEKLEWTKEQTPTSMWLSDLAELKTEYIGWLDDWYDEQKLKPKTKINLRGLSLR